MTTEISWPPPYALKISKRAKHVRFKISRAQGLEITLPYRFNQSHIPIVLEKHRAWIKKHIDDIAYFMQHGTTERLPQEIHLAAIPETWSVHYLNDSKKLRLIERNGNELIIAGSSNSYSLTKKLLTTWLKHKAKNILTEQLARISIELNLPYNKLYIKLQNTRWGSCTSKKIINLNAKLLFFPIQVVRSVLIHELCHTVHMNHSSKFWQLVTQFEPRWPEYNKILRNSVALIPDWVG